MNIPAPSPSPADSTLSATTSTGNGGFIPTRKRVLSSSNTVETESLVVRKKRPRVSSISTQFNVDSRGEDIYVNSALDRLPRSIREIEDSSLPVDFSYAAPRSLSRSSSYADLTSHPAAAPRGQSVTRALRSVRLGSECPESSTMSMAMADGMALLRRSVSVASFQSPPPVTKYPETSAKYYLRNTKVTIDYGLPPGASESVLPVSWSTQNIVMFSRGNRVHYKNLNTNANEDIGQLCRIQDTLGDLRAIECGGADQPNVVALGTSKGYVQIWDIAAKKMTVTWNTKTVTAMKWNGAVLTLGLVKGTIRHYDTRVKETPKMKEQARKITRHQSGISRLAWNSEGKLLASGDESGIIYCWDPRQNVPLDVGEMVQRRKKMQHCGVITALAWCPWKPKLLASGDSALDGTGVVRLWDIDPTSSYQASFSPEKFEPNAQVTSLHFSPHCKELLSTHGPGPNPDSSTNDPATTTPENTQSAQNTQNISAGSNSSRGMANSIAVHTVPSLRHVMAVAVASSKGLSGSVINTNATKVALVVPEENKLKVWEVWGKAKEGRRHSSFMDKSAIR